MSSSQKSLPKRQVVVVPVSSGSFADHIDVIASLGRSRTSSYAVMVNVHMTVEAHRDPELRRAVEQAELAAADGMPIVRSLQRFHRLRQERVAGNDVLPAMLQRAERDGLSVFFYGGTDEQLRLIRGKLARELPAVRVAGAYSPPFRPLTDGERDAVVETINGSGAQVVFVSLGCPKQEKWMASMRGRVQAVMLGVGGAFSVFVGAHGRAPEWMRERSLEWVYRLAAEPRRLAWRYLSTNPVYLYLFLRHWIGRSGGR